MNIINPRRKCPECGVTFTAHHGKQAFCATDHQRAFHNRNHARGKVALPLLQAWRGGRGRRGDETSAYALRELCRLADRYNEEDRAAGRLPTLIVQRKRSENWSASDLE